MCVLAGILSVGSGIAWLSLGDVVGTARFVLLTLALLGGSAFLAGGFWQWRSGPKTRVFVLVLIAVLAAADVFLNVLATVATSEVPVRAGEQRAPGVTGWHQAGLIAGGILYLATLVEGFFALRARDRALDGSVEG